MSYHNNHNMNMSGIQQTHPLSTQQQSFASNKQSSENLNDIFPRIDQPVPEFLYQLTKMLTQENKEIIEWTSCRIVVHDPPRVASEILSKYFRHSKYASFQRQLNYFGFRKIAGKGKMSPCSYINDNATSDLRSLLFIKRRTKGNCSKVKKAEKKQEKRKVVNDATSANIHRVDEPAAKRMKELTVFNAQIPGIELPKDAFNPLPVHFVSPETVISQSMNNTLLHNYIMDGRNSVVNSHPTQMITSDHNFSFPNMNFVPNMSSNLFTNNGPIMVGPVSSPSEPSAPTGCFQDPMLLPFLEDIELSGYNGDDAEPTPLEEMIKKKHPSNNITTFAPLLPLS